MSDLLAYKGLEMGLATTLDRLAEMAGKLDRAETRSSLEAAVARLAAGRFSLAVVGEFKRGKSTLINALLGEEVLPTDVLPTTATLNRLVYGMEKAVRLHKHDGSVEDIPWDQLSQYVTKLDDDSASRALAVREAVVSFPCHYCRNNVEVIDTPGLQDEEAMTRVTMSVLPSVDAVILAVSALSPLSESELSFLEKLQDHPCGRVFMVVTSIDRLGLEGDALDVQLSRLLSALRQRLERSCPGLVGVLHEEIFALSAYQALRSRRTGDSAGLRASRFETFERALETFLGQEQGALALQAALNVAQRAATDLRGKLASEKQACVLSEGEVQQRTRQAEAAAAARYDGPGPAFVWSEAELSADQAPWTSELWQMARSGSRTTAELQAVHEAGLVSLRRQVLAVLDRRWDSILDRVEKQWSHHSSSASPVLREAAKVSAQLRALAESCEQALRATYAFPVATNPTAFLAELGRSHGQPLAEVLQPTLASAQAILERALVRHRSALELVARENAMDRLQQCYRDRASVEARINRLDEWSSTLDDIDSDLAPVHARLA